MKGKQSGKRFMVTSKLFDQNNIHYYVLEPDDLSGEGMHMFSRYIQMEQVHGGKVVLSNGRDTYYPQCDGIVTTYRENIGVRTADCLPVLMSARDGKAAAAAVHAGWRGLGKGVLRVACRMLFKRTVSPSDTLVYIGPHIRECCYEVQADFIDGFGDYSATARKCQISRGGKLFFSLEKYARTELLGNSVPDGNIEISTICTHCDRRFPSYRRDKQKSQRLYSLVSVS